MLCSVQTLHIFGGQLRLVDADRSGGKVSAEFFVLIFFFLSFGQLVCFGRTGPILGFEIFSFYVLFIFSLILSTVIFKQSTNKVKYEIYSKCGKIRSKKRSHIYTWTESYNFM